MRFKRAATPLVALFMSVTLFAGCQSVQPPSVSEPQGTVDTPTTTTQNEPAPQTNKETPRNETLYINGLQWGPPTNFNLLSGNPAFPVNYGNSRELVYETLFMVNQLDGGLEPLLGNSYEWTDETTLRIELNADAKWSDGTAFTADDVVYTYELGKKYDINWSSFWTYISEVKADGAQAVEIKLNPDNPNKLTVLDSIELIPMLPKHIWEEIEKKNNNDLTAIRKEVNDNPVGTGAYKLHFYNDQKITIVRDDNYWGQKLFGKLPAPKYITHVIYKDNAAGDLAFKSGQVDVSQQFIPQVWKMWEGGAAVKTYLKDAPYYLPGSMPSIFFNLSKAGLDNADVRRAIAMSINYEKISELAMSGYSAPMQPSLTLNSDAESKYIDQDAIKSLQWTMDIEGANALLDKIGATKGKDGIRVLNGTRLGPFEVECPYGWSDWNAALEIVAQSAKAIGIEIRTKFPESPVWTNDLQTGKFDIIMNTPAGGVSPSQPWNRAMTIMYSKGVAPMGEMAFWNWGRYQNDRADAIIEEIPSVSDEAKLKSLYTELNTIWLKDIPSIPLMYRPWVFDTVNESVWKGFPTEGDGTNIPPQISMDGAGIKALYQIHN
ncbi:ABC transporter substrate-binding protein [Paenibacillus taichungensis]|uniref:ABC transporter substrate-binding protein n=1 Tax=Paenibacillus taichungensis TaxID=484184 RepID=A0ABX2MVC4_9BACL|nr:MULTISPECIES: ABC transporter substrate-binding protein [Paenibacillus]MDR9743913.1 ABC transporter substrate-binding protein [Paenibacillus taichungensis]MEC0106435.1 ABC transporter substrate-binding protein [Paenibacillus taichungensis]MEC0197007.1 ABC transporter substrate-binding protein [Paenibacillus taichungensis]NUU58034.1 ABC transporter substrate-binding protein [Paenibacillus taichungensis]PIH59376.1 ABC transporter substrate-binding protein [Paenibacillus sp. LK1]